MAKTKISEYDATAANNTDIDSINIAEGCAPSGINNAIRELMAHLKDMNIGSTITMLNTTEEDSDGGRANKIIFKGEQSGGEESVLGEIQASHDGTADDQKGDLIFKTNDGSDGTSPTEAMRIDSAQNIAIGTTAPTTFSGFKTHHFKNGSGDAISLVESDGGVISQEISADSTGVTLGSRSSHDLRITTNDTERMRIDDTGDGIMFFCTDFNSTTAGVRVEADGDFYVTADGSNGRVIYANRLGTQGTIIELAQDGTAVGNLISNSTNLAIGTGDTGLYFNQGSDALHPWNIGSNSARDNAIDLGRSADRFDDIFATNTSIQTSDENEKQDIASLTSAEITAATAISKLFKTYKWKDAVTKKGDAARIHTGHIAQQVKTAMTDAGLDASKYAFWCSNTWWEKETEVAAVEADESKNIKAQDAHTRIDTYDTKEDAPDGATERTRLGLRYAELLAFIGAATEQRLTSIEARLDALEG